MPKYAHAIHGPPPEGDQILNCISPSQPSTERKTYPARKATKRVNEKGSEQVSDEDSFHRDLAIGVISLFDGTSTAVTCIEKVIGYTADVTITAEIIPVVRALMADLHGYNVQGDEWSIDKKGRTNLYARDVWNLLGEHGLPIRNFLHILGQTLQRKRRKTKMPKKDGGLRIFLVAGSPCQNLTTHNEEFGALGATGPTSVHIHIIPVILHMLKALDADIAIFLVMENAGSMLRGVRPTFLGREGTLPANFAEYIRRITGFRNPTAEKKMKAADRGAVVDRNRTFFTSAMGFTVEQDAVTDPWEDGWESPCITKGNQMVPKIKMPWLRTRGFSDEAGTLVYTYGAYSPWNMLYQTSFFGGSAQFAELTVTKPPIQWLDWKALLGEEACQALVYLLEHEIHAFKTGRFHPTKDKVIELDKCAVLIAKALHLCENAPVRLPTIKEKLKESELESYFDGIDVTRTLLTEQTLSDLIGNFFKPSIVRAAIQGRDGQACQQFLEGHFEKIIVPQVPPLAEIQAAYKELVNITARYVNSEFPSVINKIQEHWAPVGRRITQRWLDELGKLGPTPLAYKPRAMRITPQHVQALLGPKRHRVEHLESRQGHEKPFPAWLAKCLVKTRGTVDQQMKANGLQSCEIAEAFRETHLLATLYNAPPTHAQKTLMEEIENTKHPIEALVAYDKLAKITPSVQETLVVHVQGIGTQHTLICPVANRASIFVITVTPETVYFTYASEEAYTDRQYKELMHFLSAASRIQTLDQNFINLESDEKLFLLNKLKLNQAVAVAWTSEGLLGIVFQQTFWNFRGSLADAIVSAYGLLNTGALQTSVGPQAEDGISEVQALIEAVDQKLQTCSSTVPDSVSAITTYKITGQGEPVAKGTYVANRKDAAIQGVTLVINIESRIAFWAIGGPPLSDPHGIT